MKKKVIRFGVPFLVVAFMAGCGTDPVDEETPVEEEMPPAEEQETDGVDTH